MQANSCITLADIKGAETEFKSAYPYMDILDENYYTLLATFINHKYAGNYSAHKVQDMIESDNQTGLLCVENLREESPLPTAFDCMKEQMKFAVIRAINDYEVYIEQERLTFYKRYTDKCMSVVPSLILSGNVKEYHYTLYYYDQSGNLVKTVPPAGVRLLEEPQISTLMTNPSADISNMHLMATVYKYNSLNQVVWQSSPDGGQTEFWYDKLGRLFASRNEVQKGINAYSYTMYDELGRIKEVGEKKGSGTEFASSDQALHGSSFPDLVIRKHDDNSIDRYEANNSIVFEEGFDTGDDPYLVAEIITQPDDEENLRRFYASGENDQVTRTLYTESSNLPAIEGSQENLRSRVSMSEYLERVNSQLTRRSASHYSYDVAGNVKTLWQENTQWGELSPTNQFKKLRYQYDLVSGKVNEVWYQQGKTDAFAHRYLYDGENRLTGAYTSRDGFIWKKEAGYQYFLHGPLQRMELGGDVNDKRIVQGIDYTYTLQGWLKAINGVRLGEANDPGRDGAAGSTIPKDVLAYTIGYYNGDYKSIDPMLQWNLQYQFTQGHPIGAGLYNGNIGYTTIERSHDQGKVMGYSYGYDQLNRLKEFRSHNIANNATSWSYANIDPDDAFKETVTYDGNGNIRTYLRNSATGAMDKLTYWYYYQDAGGIKKEYDPSTTELKSSETPTNQLARVADPLGKNPALGDLGGQPTENYQYDKIGNLILDTDEGLTNIAWTVYGKIKSINKSQFIRYRYDASGSRVSKGIFNSEQEEALAEKGKRTMYVRDAQGNTMAIYEKEPESIDWTLSELQLYGSSRLGTYKPNVNATTIGLNTGIGHDGYLAGTREYELSNHLGNVLVTVSDKKIGHSSNGTIDYYEADVVSSQDYYPGGMQMPGRKFNSFSNRYGFQNQETDNELWGGAVSFKYRVEDPRLVRFFSIDPLTVKYPHNSPYAFSENRLIDGKELEGLEYATIHHYADGTTGKKEQYKASNKYIKDAGGTPSGIYNSAAYGSLGKGVVHYYWNDNGEIYDTRWDQQQTGGNSDFAYHGLYSGPGSITKDGGANSRNYDFSFQPIDWSDAIAKRHDMDYEAATATGEKSAGFIEDVRTLQADKDMIQRINDYKSIFKSVQGVETPYRTSWSAEMELSMKGQSVVISALATYKQWKIDHNYGNKDTYDKLRNEFRKDNKAVSFLIDKIVNR